jgi:3-methyl-2-oxobutanoate hydroxymethyltransferase
MGEVMGEKWTSVRIRNSKGREKLACVAAYDCAMARVIDAKGLPLVLVGDSLAMAVLGYETTLPVTMEQMLHHTAAVVRGVRDALVVADMPFMSYQVSTEQAVYNAGRFIKEAGAGAVKIEGGALRVPVVKALVANGIPVLGHIGLTPQSVREMGGYKVQGKKPQDAERVLQDAAELESAGVFALVIECVPSALGGEITRSVKVPTIGIGAGPECDGQILVAHDLLGLSGDRVPKFVKRYADLGSQMAAAFSAYRSEVLEGTFPSEEHGY